MLATQPMHPGTIHPERYHGLYDALRNGYALYTHATHPGKASYLTCRQEQMHGRNSSSAVPFVVEWRAMECTPSPADAVAAWLQHSCSMHSALLLVRCPTTVLLTNRLYDTLRPLAQGRMTTTAYQCLGGVRREFRTPKYADCKARQSRRRQLGA